RCTISCFVSCPCANVPLTIVQTPTCSGPIETLQMKPPIASASSVVAARSARRRRASAAGAAPALGAGTAVTSLRRASHVRQVDRHVLVVEQMDRLLSDQLARREAARL